MKEINKYYTPNTHSYMLFKDGKFADFIFASIEQVVGKDYKKHAVAIEVGAEWDVFLSL